MRQLKHFSANGRTNDCDNEFFSSSAFDDDDCAAANDVFGSAYGNINEATNNDGNGGVGDGNGRISRLRRKRRYNHQQQYDLFDMDTNQMTKKKKKKPMTMTKLNDCAQNVNGAVSLRSVLERVQCEISNLRSKTK